MPKLIMQSFWFGDLEGGICNPAPDDPANLARRVKALGSANDVPLPEWEIAVYCGFVKDRAGYLEKLHGTAIAFSVETLQEKESADASGLIQMVRMLDQIDEAINLLTERASDWHHAVHPGFNRKSIQVRGTALIDVLRQDARGTLLNILVEIDRLADQRRKLTRNVVECADRILPNSSALIGGLVAARLAAEAGGIQDLARMPASSLQVLGARNALFAHLSTGSPPPKHGIVYQHSRVHGTRKDRRGRVARVLAAKLAIATKIDFFRKEADTSFIRTAQEAIRRAGEPP
jgi:nucleolar protein 56